MTHNLEPRFGIALNLVFGTGQKNVDTVTLPDGQVFTAEDIDQDLVELAMDGAIWEDRAKAPGFLAYLEEQGTVKRVRQKGRPDRFLALDRGAFSRWYEEAFLPALHAFADRERPVTCGIRDFCSLYDFYDLIFDGTSLEIPTTWKLCPITILMKLSAYLAGHGWDNWEIYLGNPELLISGASFKVLFPNLKREENETDDGTDL